MDCSVCTYAVYAWFMCAVMCAMLTIDTYTCSETSFDTRFISDGEYIDEKFVFHNFLVRILCVCVCVRGARTHLCILLPSLVRLAASLFACDMMIMFTLSFYYCYVVVLVAATRFSVSRIHQAHWRFIYFSSRSVSLRRRSMFVGIIWLCRPIQLIFCCCVLYVCLCVHDGSNRMGWTVLNNDGIANFAFSSWIILQKIFIFLQIVAVHGIRFLVYRIPYAKSSEFISISKCRSDHSHIV